MHARVCEEEESTTGLLGGQEMPTLAFSHPIPLVVLLGALVAGLLVSIDDFVKAPRVKGVPGSSGPFGPQNRQMKRQEAHHINLSGYEMASIPGSPQSPRQRDRGLLGQCAPLAHLNVSSNPSAEAGAGRIAAVRQVHVNGSIPMATGSELQGDGGSQYGKGNAHHLLI